MYIITKFTYNEYIRPCFYRTLIVNFLPVPPPERWIGAGARDLTPLGNPYDKNLFFSNHDRKLLRTMSDFEK